MVSPATPPALPALPPEEAIGYLKAKGRSLTETWDWRDFWQQDHAAAFTVAKSAGYDVLTDIHSALVSAMEKGTPFEQFAAGLTPILQAKGWWGRVAAVDPADPDAGPKTVQLGSLRRLRIIFDTNMRTSWAAGRWQQVMRTVSRRPWLRYVAVLDRKTRPLHREWHGTILPALHAWWRTHFPPNGWYCRCTVQSVDEADLQRYGWAVNAEPPDDGPPQAYRNARTGEVSIVPAGIDPGFGYNPGETAVDVHAARIAVTKWLDGPPRITAAAQADSARFLLPKLQVDFDQWIGGITEKIAQGEFRPAGELRVVGALTDRMLDTLAARGIEPQSGAITITDKEAGHILRDSKTARGAAISTADLTRLPEIIQNPVQVLFDQQDPALIFVFVPATIGDRSLGKFVLRVNVRQKVGAPPRAKITTNAVTTAGLLNPTDLDVLLPGSTGRRYVLISEATDAQGVRHPPRS